MTATPAPTGLAPGSVRLWRELTAAHAFADFELVTFEKALRWFDRSDALLAQAADLPDVRARTAALKIAMDASTCGLRFWRQLKFTNGAAARRPGRPSDQEWSAKRRKLQQVG